MTGSAAARFFADGVPEAFGDRDAEARLAAAAALRTPLAGSALVEVRGADATDFLHAQLAADLRQVAAGDAVLTAWCSPKGRVLFMPRVLRGEHAWLLVLPAVVAGACVKRLRMFVLRAAVEIEDRSATHAVVRLDAADAADAADAGLCAARDGDQQWLAGPREALAARWDALPGRPVGHNAALLADIRRGVPTLDPALADVFLPQELDLDRLEGVSFEKGCYPGQEIVARVRFRGSVKRRPARFALRGETLPPAGARLLDAAGAACGTVLAAAHTDRAAIELLAVLDCDAEASTIAGFATAGLTHQPLARDDVAD